MNRAFLTWVVGSVALAALPSAGAALSLKSPQQLCDYARVKAWRTYVSAMESHVALDARGSWLADHFLAFAISRHNYLSQWDKFQTKRSLAGSSCIGSRFTDDGTTVTDNLSGLQWEKKTTDGSVQDLGDLYPWSAGGTAADGGAFQTLLVGLNAPTCVAGQCDWRLPTMEELQTILLDFPCIGDGVGTSCHCPSSPCIDGIFGPTQSDYYWSGTSSIPNPSAAWTVDFNTATVVSSDKNLAFYVRAVRGGL